MDAYFPHALVTGHEALEEAFPSVAREDRHVAAAAHAARAEYIVTQNVRDFPADALPRGLVAISADEFVRVLVRQDATTTRAALEAHRLGLRHPPLDSEAYRAAFILNGLSRSAAALWP